MLRFFFRRPRIEDKDTPFNEFRDPYLEEVIEKLRLDLQTNSAKLEDETLEKEPK